MQGHDPAQITHQRRNTEYHRFGGTGLAADTVNLEPELKVLGIGHFVLGHQPRTDWAEAVESFAFVPSWSPLYLVLTFRDVIHHAITRHVIQRLRFGDPS